MLNCNFHTGKSRITNKGLAGFLGANHGTITRSIVILQQIGVITIEYKDRRIITLVHYCPARAEDSKATPLPTKSKRSQQGSSPSVLRSSGDPFNQV